MVLRADANPGSEREAYSGKPVVRIDWLEGGMVPFIADGDTALSWLQGDHARAKGRITVRGFQRWEKDGYGTLLGHAVERIDEQGVVEPHRAYLILKGSGLAALRNDDELCDRNVLHRFATWGGLCARIDLAVDVLHPDVTPTAVRALWPRRFSSRLALGRDLEPRDPRMGRTFYLIGNEVLIRWYDKSAERRVHKGAPLPDGVTRVEIQLRGREAKRAMRDLLAIPAERWATDFPALVIGLILSKARPLNGLCPPRNPQRVKTWLPLDEAFGGAVPARLSADELNRSALQRVGNLARYVSQSMQAVALLERLGQGPPMQQMRASTILTPENEIVALALESDPKALRAVAEALIAAGGSPPKVQPETPPLFPDTATGDDGAT